jgi:hypothetical protein
MSTNTIVLKEQELLCPSFIVQLIVYSGYIHDILADSTAHECLTGASGGR